MKIRTGEARGEFFSPLAFWSELMAQKMKINDLQERAILFAETPRWMVQGAKKWVENQSQGAK